MTLTLSKLHHTKHIIKVELMISGAYKVE